MPSPADRSAASPNSTSVATDKSRRSFLTSGAAMGALALGGGLSFARSAHAAGSDELRIGLVGCGGRGTGAANQALSTKCPVKLVAVGDAFQDAAEGGLQTLMGDPALKDKIDVPADRVFHGFDAYKQVMDNCDVVLLATPPHFRPAHLEYAVQQGKHIFCEKPVCVDAPGYHRALAASAVAKEKGLALVSGLCWRYDYGVRDTIKRVQDGQIGDIIAIQANYNAGGLWNKPRQPHWSDMEYQVRNWLYYTWLSGDHNVEQHVHTLDKGAWIMGDTAPVRCVGLGGRQSRIDARWGNIFDHHAVTYEFANGVRMYSFCRQQDNTAHDNSCVVLGTKGQADILRFTIKGETESKFNGERPNMYQVEHDELFASIHNGKPINNGLYMCQSSMIAVMGRMATYTGQQITWDQAISSKEDLSPASYEWGPIETPPVARPGITKFS